MNSKKVILGVGKSVSAHIDRLVLIGKITYLTPTAIEVKMTSPFKGVRLSREIQYTAQENKSYLEEYGLETARDLLRQIYLNSQKLLLVQEDIRKAYPVYLDKKSSLSERLASLHHLYHKEEGRQDIDELSAEALEHEFRLSQLEDNIRDTSAKLLLLPEKVFSSGDIPLGFVRGALQPLFGLAI